MISEVIINTAVVKFDADKHGRTYKTYDQFVSMLFGQLNRCLTLRDISLSLGINPAFLSDMGLEQNPAKSTMSDGDKKRGWRVFEDIFFKIMNDFGNLFKDFYYNYTLILLTIGLDYGIHFNLSKKMKLIHSFQIRHNGLKDIIW